MAFEHGSDLYFIRASLVRTIFTAVDVKLALAAYLFPGLGVIIGIPMALSLIPPNRFYGYRTRKTFSSTATWYRANRFAGWAMVIAGLLALAHNQLFLHDHADWSSPTQQLFLTLSTAVLLFVAMMISSFYIRKL